MFTIFANLLPTVQVTSMISSVPFLIALDIVVCDLKELFMFVKRLLIKIIIIMCRLIFKPSGPIDFI